MLVTRRDYAHKFRGVTFSRLWRRYLSLKCDGPIQGGPPPFQSHCLVDVRWRTINWASEINRALAIALLCRLLEIPAHNDSALLCTYLTYATCFVARGYFGGATTCLGDGPVMFRQNKGLTQYSQLGLPFRNVL